VPVFVTKYDCNVIAFLPEISYALFRGQNWGTFRVFAVYRPRIRTIIFCTFTTSHAAVICKQHVWRVTVKYVCISCTGSW